MENGVPGLVPILMEYFVKHITELDSPRKNQRLTIGEFDNIAVSLQLTDALLSGCSDQTENEIQNLITNIPGVARASSVLIEHLHDNGKSTACNHVYIVNISAGSSKAFQLNALKSLLLIMLRLSDSSPQMCRELGSSSFVVLLSQFLEYFANQPLLNEVR